MDRQTDVREEVQGIIERELGIVRSAIELVASGGAPRVALGSLRFAEQLIRPARRMALGRGVRIVPQWNIDESGAGLVVERLGDG
jgi:hypothetical protein